MDAAGIDVNLGAAGRIVDMDAALRAADFDIRRRRFLDDRGRSLFHGSWLALIATGKHDHAQSDAWQNSHDIFFTGE